MGRYSDNEDEFFDAREVFASMSNSGSDCSPRRLYWPVMKMKFSRSTNSMFQVYKRGTVGRSNYIDAYTGRFGVPHMAFNSINSTINNGGLLNSGVWAPPQPIQQMRTYTRVLYHCEWRGIGGLYASLLLIVHHFIHDYGRFGGTMKATVLCNIDWFKPTSAMRVEASTTAVIIFCLQSGSCFSTSKDILQKGGGQNRHTRDTSVDIDGNIADLQTPPKAPSTKRGFGFSLFKKTTDTTAESGLEVALYPQETKIPYLDEWDQNEKDHSISLGGAVKDMESSSLHLLVLCGAKPDVDVMQRISGKLIGKLEENGGELPSSDSSIKEDLSSLTIHLFLYIKESHGIEKAFQFLSNVKSGEEDALVLHHVEGASDC
ncbi:unnamed protein product [Lactuca saligna]|uniref:Uncharacterized protein n=1 Tax=Lactuca saligna TaxID=75948 RepID=A0AA35V3G1_LACSI|nr:unnamed protein product [Lactuca saligna]